MAAITPRLQVPRTDYPKLRALLTLSDGSFQELVSAIQRTPATLPPAEFVRHISSKANSAFNVVDDVVDLLITLSGVRTEHELSVADFADAISQAMDETGRDDLRPNDGNWGPFKQRLSALLQLESISVTAKAIDLRIRNEHTFIDAQIVTDLRPVFSADLPLNIAAAIIEHGLRITYIEGRETKDFHVALDTQDLETLRNLLNRAESKAQSLVRLTERSSISVLGEE